LFLFMSTYVDDLRMNTQGSTIQYLKKAQFTEAPINLPPLVEQRRIVDVVESVDNYIAALQARVDAVRITRNAVLHELLNAGGDDWVETTLGDIAELRNGDRGKNYPSAASRVSNGVPFINAGHLTDWRVDFSQMDYIPLEVFNKLTGGKIQEFDVLFCLRGTVGKFALVADSYIGAIASSLIIVRCRESVQPTFMMLFLASEGCKEQIELNRNGAVQPNLSAKSLSGFITPLPPLVEQKRIVDVVSSMDDSIQASEQTIVEAKNLRSGLLSDLLSGEHEIPAVYDKLLGAA